MLKILLIGLSVLPNMTNNATDALTGGFQVPRDIQIGVTILAVIVIILAMIGNTLVIHIVFTVSHMRSSTNILIANMAIADLLMTIDIPYILKWLYVWDKWFRTFMGTVLCKFLHAAQVGSLAASVFSLVAISLDRSFAILFPMKKVMTRNVVRFAIATTWLGALALMLPLMIATKNAKLEGRDGMTCREDWKTMSYKIYITIVIVTAYVIPLIIIALVYCLAGLRLRRRKLPGHQNPTAQKKVQASSRRATTMLMTVAFIFALSWFPLQALEMIRIYNSTLFYKIPMKVRFVVPWFSYCNSAINPVLYMIFSGNYRRELHRIFCGGKIQQSRSKAAVVAGYTSRQRRHRATRETSNVEWDTPV